MDKRFYITTPIYYVNSKPHIGGAYTTIMADAIARFMRLKGYNVNFLTGTDEHGQKIEQSAEKDGVEPSVFVDSMAQHFIDLRDLLSVSTTDFIRTTENRHKTFVQEKWRELIKNGWLYKGKYSGWYCVSDEAYYSEDELIKDGDVFKTELGKTVEWREEESYFFRLSEFQKLLLTLYTTTDFIAPESRRNEIISFVAGTNLKDAESGRVLEGHLKDLSVSRNTFNWGIKIPCDDENKNLIDDKGEWLDGLQENEKHVMYVWLDALFNYQSAPHSKGKLQKYWYDNENKIHFVGKDIVRFHTVYWPAFLIAIHYSREQIADIEDMKAFLADVESKNILPKKVFAHGWWTNNGLKISKSLGNSLYFATELEWLQQDFKLDKTTALDYLKYFLTTEMSFGNDGDYSRDRLVERLNSELSNTIGNLIQRVLSMVYKNFGGKLTPLQKDSLDEIDRDNLYFTDNLLSNMDNELEKDFDLQNYKNQLLAIATKANEYMDKRAPWSLAKTGNTEELQKVLALQVEVIRKIALLLQPLCPVLAAKALDFLDISNRSLAAVATGELHSYAIEQPQAIFPRLVK